MPQRKDLKNRPWKPRRRGEPDTPPTVAKSYTLPVSVFLAIRKAAGEYGSQGRAVQVGSEILSRLQDPISVKEVPPSSQIRMTYKLAPRTVRLIHRLTETAYQNSGQVLAACMKALKLKGLTLSKKVSR
ncbi:MAG TPA: hypothetical protein VFP71_01105 [Candidatus Angelobacter sp.]|nr:hypothetical protein [Candidatus Angelobacter sp.]